MINIRDIRFQILATCAVLIMIGLIFIYNTSATQAIRLERNEL